MAAWIVYLGVGVFPISIRGFVISSVSGQLEGLEARQLLSIILEDNCMLVVWLVGWRILG